nr:unnamed protein product [Callosobruchus chinensis]
MPEKPCKLCLDPVNRKNPGLQCSGFCSGFSHGRCLELSMKQLDSLRSDGVSWMCKNCREDRGGTIMRRSTGSTLLHTPLVSQCSSAPAGCSNGSATDSVTFCSEKISDFEAKLLKFDEYFRITEKLIQENHELKTEVANLQNRLNDMEQHSRTYNIEIQGVPEKRNENLMEIVKDIGKHVNCDTNADKVDYIHRVQHNINSKNKIKSIKADSHLSGIERSGATRCCARRSVILYSLFTPKRHLWK